jgi:hypothetical protein
MHRFYRQHYAPGRSPIFNLAIDAAIAVKFVGSCTRSLWRRRLSPFRPATRS